MLRRTLKPIKTHRTYPNNKEVFVLLLGAIQPSARQTTTIVLVAVVVCPAALVNVPRIIVAVSDNDSRQSTIPA
jgi:hypothetical protein